MTEREDIASILDDALNDLEKCEEAEVLNARNGQVQVGNLDPESESYDSGRNETSSKEDGLDFKQMLNQFVEGCNEDKNRISGQAEFVQFAHQLEEELSQIQTGASPDAGKKETEEHFTTTLATILDDIAEAITQEGKEENRMWKDDLSLSGESINTEMIVEGMMEQLLSKDLMYEPMKEVSDRFPAWIAANKDLLSDDKLLRLVNATSFD